jgi:hypothetical protein
VFGGERRRWCWGRKEMGKQLRSVWGGKWMGTPTFFCWLAPVVWRKRDGRGAAVWGRKIQVGGCGCRIGGGG